MRQFKMQMSTQREKKEEKKRKKREKNVATNENCILTKMSLKFQNLISTFYAK